MKFGHEQLDVYKLSVEYVAWVYQIARRLKGIHRHTRDQWIRSSQSVPLNIAEGNGKGTLPDRRRYFEIARGSALESAATQDVLVVCEALTQDDSTYGKEMLYRIVSMLTVMGKRESQVREMSQGYFVDKISSPSTGFDYDSDYDNDNDNDQGGVV